MAAILLSHGRHDALFGMVQTRVAKKLLTLSRLGKRLVSVLESSAHKSVYSGPINMILSEKWICYVLSIHVACSIMQIGPLVPKLQQVTGCVVGRVAS